MHNYYIPFQDSLIKRKEKEFTYTIIRKLMSSHFFSRLRQFFNLSTLLSGAEIMP